MFFFKVAQVIPNIVASYGSVLIMAGWTASNRSWHVTVNSIWEMERTYSVIMILWHTSGRLFSWKRKLKILFSKTGPQDGLHRTASVWGGGCVALDNRKKREREKTPLIVDTLFRDSAVRVFLSRRDEKTQAPRQYGTAPRWLIIIKS